MMSGSQRVLVMVVLAVIGVALAGCGTVRGVGQDIQDAGRAIKRAAG